MGNSASSLISYAVPVQNSQTPESTTIFRAVTHPDGLVENFTDTYINNEWELFIQGYNVSGGKSKCLGYRKRSDQGVLAPYYSWLTYEETKTLALYFGTNLQQLYSDCLESLSFEDELYPPARNLKLFGLYCKNRYEWFVCEFAAAAYNWTLIPLYDSLSHESLVYIFKETRLKIIACSLQCLPHLLKATKQVGFIKRVILFMDSHENLSVDLLKQAKESDVDICLYSELCVKPKCDLIDVCPGDIDSVNTVCYTSGTTGLPKGVLLTQKNIISCIAGVTRGPGTQSLFINKNDRTISYLPLAHVLERLVSCLVLTIGAEIGFYSGDTGALLDDVQVLKPTLFVSVPRLFNRINDAVFRGIAGKAPLTRYLFSRAKTAKLEKLRMSASATNKFWDSLVFNKTRKLMGTELRYMISGGAPLDALVQEHMKILFCVPLLEGYGLTETFGPAFLANAKDPVAGHVGGAIPSTEFKLISVPELNYFVTDSNPRGEILIRGHSVTVGYFQNAAETKELLDKDGWFHTGDIGVLLHNGAIKIIDRKKNIFKLSQGEYVAPEKIENVYLQVSYVSQIFVYGQPDKSFLVAIVVPDEAVVQTWIKQNSFDAKKVTSCGYLPELKEVIMKEMNTIATNLNLKGFEKVKDIYLETDPFTIDSGLLTPTLKLKRQAARTKYEAQISEMYQNILKLK